MGIIIRMSRTGLTDGDGGFDWNDAVIDAGIAAGLTFFTTLAAVAIIDLFQEPYKCVVAAFIAAGAQFFSWLALKRGIVRKE